MLPSLRLLARGLRPVRFRFQQASLSIAVTAAASRATALASFTRSAVRASPRPAAPTPRALNLREALHTEAAAEDPNYERGLAQLDSGDLSAAIESFAAAAAAGSADGNFYLGLAYDGLMGENARGEPVVEADPAAAVRCYTRAAEAGHCEAMLNLSMSLRNGDGVEQNVAAAFKWLERSAALGSARAAFNAGVALDPLHPPWGRRSDASAASAAGGDMLPKDATRAVEYYRKAVELGHEKAQVNLGVALYTGTGVAEDKAAAAKLWKAASEDGVSEADMCLRNSEDADAPVAEDAWNLGLQPPDAPAAAKPIAMSESDVERAWSEAAPTRPGAKKLRAKGKGRKCKSKR